MKRFLFLVLLILTIVILTSCDSKFNNGLVISKLFDAKLMDNNVIELYNNSSDKVNLSNYHIRIFTNGSDVATKEINLNGEILANDYFVISGSDSLNSYINTESDFRFEGYLPYNGNDAIGLYHKNTLVDFIGYNGIDIPYAENITLIRMGEPSDYVATETYDEYNYIAYLPDVFQYLGNSDYDIKLLSDLIEGPKLEDRYFELPYVDQKNESLGGGGIALTELLSVADGDTAYFRAMNGYPGGSLRYFYINTPEVDGTYVNAEPWGYVASKYNKEYLLNESMNKVIHVQSIPGYSLFEGNGRNLGLVWINGNLSQFLIVAEGLSEKVGSTYSEYDLMLSYKDVPYLTFLRFAEYIAVQNGWGVKGYPTNEEGEKSPDWNYQSNSKSTDNPIWIPNLVLPWE